MQFDEREPPPHGRVQQRDGTVGGVHRADDEQVLGQPERLRRAVLQLDRLVAVLQQEVQLAEDLGQVRAVHLVDDQDVRLVWRSPLAVRPCDAAQRPGGELERRLPAVGLVGPEALEEVLVGVRGVELDQLAVAGFSAPTMCRASAIAM